VDHAGVIYPAFGYRKYRGNATIAEINLPMIKYFRVVSVMETE
jgi:hypothetical protein